MLANKHEVAQMLPKLNFRTHNQKTLVSKNAFELGKL